MAISRKKNSTLRICLKIEKYTRFVSGVAAGPQKELFSNYHDICGLRKISKVGVNLLLGCGLRTIFHQSSKFVVNDLRNVIGCGKHFVFKSRKNF